jgi:hypothetical protein
MVRRDCSSMREGGRAGVSCTLAFLGWVDASSVDI